MNLKDSITNSMIILKRRRNKKLNSVILFIVCIVTMLTLTFNKNVSIFLSNALNNFSQFRTLFVGTEEDVESSIEKILSVEHVLDAYSGEYGSIVVSSPDFTTNNVSGKFELHRGTSKVLPKIVKGRALEDNEEGTMICPTKFYPEYSSLEIDRKELLKGKELLGKEITVQYHDYYLEGMYPKEQNTYEKKFTIVGLYDVSSEFNTPDICYVSESDMKEIVDTEIAWEREKYKDSPNISISYGITTIVDSRENVEYVIDKINEMGYYANEPIAEVDEKTYEIVYMTITIVIFIALLTTVLITLSYEKKKLNQEEQNIGVLRFTGYKKKDISLLYSCETFINNSRIYLVGIITYLVLYFMAINYIPILVTVNIMMGGIKLGISTFLITYVLIVIFPSITTYLKVSSKLKKESQLLKNN